MRRIFAGLAALSLLGCGGGGSPTSPLGSLILAVTPSPISATASPTAGFSFAALWTLTATLSTGDGATIQSVTKTLFNSDGANVGSITLTSADLLALGANAIPPGGVFQLQDGLVYTFNNGRADGRLDIAVTATDSRGRGLSASTTVAIVAGAGLPTPTPPPGGGTPQPTPTPSVTPGPSGLPVCGILPSSGLQGCRDVTGICNDGMGTCSQNQSGTCSSHGGLRCVRCPGPLC